VPTVCASEPSAFTLEEIDDFVALVLAGGEVNPNGLKGRVMRAPHIAFLRENHCLLGVGGLKKPSDNHRNDVELGSKTNLSAETVPFELGWVFILPSARNRKLSFPLCRALVSAANGKGIFATSRSNNGGMHRTLEKLGFIRVGSEWPSLQNDGTLALFLKNAV
jgi:hypothetical protein